MLYYYYYLSATQTDSGKRGHSGGRSSSENPMQTSYWFTSPISDVGPSVFSFVTLLVISSLLFAPGTVLHRADIRCLFTELNANQAATDTLLLLFIYQSTKPAEHRNCCVCFLTPSIPWPHHENVLLILELPEQPRHSPF